MGTRTGNFPIGFRRGWTEWQKRDLKALAGWAKGTGFDAVDLGAVTKEDVETVKAGGLRVGSGDLLDFGNLMATDGGKRKELIARNVQYVKEASAAGVKAFFTCVLPGDPSAKRAENYRLAVESYAPICEAAAAAGSAVVIEGYPGGPPWYAAICCTPETVRAFLKDVPRGAALNYDPSHLIRLGVDHVRFLNEFVGHVKHVHAKDTELFPEARYELGVYQGSAFADGHGFGEHAWRYTLPGHGVARWPEIMKVLKASGFAGVVSVELEDENFNGTEAGEKAGLVHSLNFLRGV
jgi:sugar phosphate isomerase/epimerase